MSGRTVVFVGPSLGRADVLAALPDAEVAPPAAQGDLHAATLDGAQTIVLVDGVFHAVRSVWHKEILAALAHGVRVIGAASVGALRAAECAAFGMEPIGIIARAYLAGQRTSDADVAVAHADASAEFRALSEAQVNVEASLATAVHAAELSPADASALADLSRHRFYAQRTWAWLLAEARRRNLLESVVLDRFGSWLPGNIVDQKAIDAREAVEAAARPAPVQPERTWSLARTGYWEAAEAEIIERRAARNGNRTTRSAEIDLVLDELRLDQRDHQIVAIAGQARRLAERLHEASGLVVTPAETRTALTELRRHLRLRSAQDVDRWRADQGLGTDAFRSLVRGEAKLRGPPSGTSMIVIARSLPSSSGVAAGRSSFAGRPRSASCWRKPGSTTSRCCDGSAATPRCSDGGGSRPARRLRPTSRPISPTTATTVRPICSTRSAANGCSGSSCQTPEDPEPNAHEDCAASATTAARVASMVARSARRPCSSRAASRARARSSGDLRKGLPSSWSSHHRDLSPARAPKRG